MIRFEICHFYLKNVVRLWSSRINSRTNKYKSYLIRNYWKWHEKYRSIDTWPFFEKWMIKSDIKLRKTEKVKCLTLKWSYFAEKCHLPHWYCFIWQFHPLRNGWNHYVIVTSYLHCYVHYYVLDNKNKSIPLCVRYICYVIIFLRYYIYLVLHLTMYSFQFWSFFNDSLVSAFCIVAAYICQPHILSEVSY